MLLHLAGDPRPGLLVLFDPALELGTECVRFIRQVAQAQSVQTGLARHQSSSSSSSLCVPIHDAAPEVLTPCLCPLAPSSACFRSSTCASARWNTAEGASLSPAGVVAYTKPTPLYAGSPM